jgi:16S rRNA (uracil1498-N3)-methyltransferase
MRIPRIYTQSPLTENSQLQLEAEPSKHLAKVLRMKSGDSLTIFNGGGEAFSASILSANKGSVVVEVGSGLNEDLESALSIHLGIAVSRGDRMDWVVQKATELGVTEITPLFTERTEVKLAGERAQKKLRHWQQITINACQQCGRNRLPITHPITELGAWHSGVEADCKLVLHHRASPLDYGSAPTSIALLVGPEGGLTEIEIESAEQVGFQSLRLGPRVLRTETAPLAAIAILQAQWGDMRP